MDDTRCVEDGFELTKIQISRLLQMPIGEIEFFYFDRVTR